MRHDRPPRTPFYAPVMSAAKQQCRLLASSLCVPDPNNWAPSLPLSGGRRLRRMVRTIAQSVACVACNPVADKGAVRLWALCHQYIREPFVAKAAPRGPCRPGRRHRQGGGELRSAIFRKFSAIFRNFPQFSAIFPQFSCNFLQLVSTPPPPPPDTGQPSTHPGVVPKWQSDGSNGCGLIHGLIDEMKNDEGRVLPRGGPKGGTSVRKTGRVPSLCNVSVRLLTSLCENSFVPCDCLSMPLFSRERVPMRPTRCVHHGCLGTASSSADLFSHILTVCLHVHPLLQVTRQFWSVLHVFEVQPRPSWGIKMHPCHTVGFGGAGSPCSLSMLQRCSGASEGASRAVRAVRAYVRLKPGWRRTMVHKCCPKSVIGRWPIVLFG